MHRYGELTGGHRPGWELIDEHLFTALAAVEAFGLNAIVAALVRMLKDASEMVILKEEIDARLVALASVLEALR